MRLLLISLLLPYALIQAMEAPGFDQQRGLTLSIAAPDGAELRHIIVDQAPSTAPPRCRALSFRGITGHE